MKFIEGVMIGGLIGVGAVVMYNEIGVKNDAKKMMKKGKKFIKKMGIL